MKLAFAILVLAVGSAAAHPLDMGYLRVHSGGGDLAITLDIDIAVAESLLKVEQLDSATAAARSNELATATYRMVAPSIDGAPCTWTTANAKIIGRSVSMSETAKCPIGSKLRWELVFVKQMASTFQVLGKVRSGDAERVFVLEKDRLTVDFVGGGPSAGFAEMMWRGVVHSLPLKPGPIVPEGLDHLIFALALVLAGGSWRRILALAGVVTLAHAAGSALAFVGIDVPGPIVMFSPLLIGVVAACSLNRRFEVGRWIAAALFAAIHGPGWRGTFYDATTWFAFDLGAALAQLACVVAFAPVVMAIQQREDRDRLTRYGALAIVAASVFFVVDSLLF